jgi:DNA-binding LytR/AlgR family response regulator
MTNNLTVLIVDDEKDSRDLLKLMLKDFGGVEVINEAENTESALFKFLGHKPDLVLLDLVMPGKSGIEFVELLKKQKIETDIVIVSAHSNMAIDAIKNEVYDFLLKPVSHSQLKNVINKVKKKKAESSTRKLDNILNNVKSETKLMLSSATSHLMIDPNEILYCEAKNSLTKIHLEDGSMELSNSSLGKLEEVLANYNFFRIGRSTLINLDKLWRATRTDNSCTLLANKKKEVKLYGGKYRIRELCEMKNQ